jgi:hypothetical protein
MSGREERTAKMHMAVVGAAALVVTVGLGACGSSDDKAAPDQKRTPTASGEQRAILQTIDQLQAASRRGDAAKICNEVFTRTLAASIKAASKRGCRAEVKQGFASANAQISVSRELTVKGSRATAVIREQNGEASRLFMVKEAGRWRIERVQPLNAQ